MCSGLGEGHGLERSESGTKVMLYFLRVPLQGAYRVLNSESRKWSSQCELFTSQRGKGEGAETKSRPYKHLGEFKISFGKKAQCSSQYRQHCLIQY